jgi:hypothetical protein
MTPELYKLIQIHSIMLFFWPKGEGVRQRRDSGNFLSGLPSCKSSQTFLDRCYEIYSDIRGGLLCCVGNLPSQIGVTGNPRWYRTCSPCDSKTRRLDNSLFAWFRSSWCTTFHERMLKYFSIIFLAILRPCRYEMKGVILRLSQA